MKQVEPRTEQAGLKTKTKHHLQQQKCIAYVPLA